MLLSGDRSEFSYYRAFLRFTRPEFVITMEDNNPLFYATKILFKDATSIAIQNGLRTSLAHSAATSFGETLQRQHTLGYDADIIATLGGLGTDFYRRALPNSKGRVVEIGSVINNAVALSSDPPSSNSRRIVFVSKFPNLGSEGEKKGWVTDISVFVGTVGLTDEQYFFVDALIAQTCARIAAEWNMPFVVLGKRPIWQVGEFEYFSKHLVGLQWDYLPSVNQSSSYESISQSDIIVNVDSTIGYEFMARGLRVASVAARMQACGHPEVTLLQFGYPLIREESGPFWTSVASESEIRRVIHTAATATVEEWEYLTQNVREMLFQFDAGNTRLCAELDALGIKNTGPRSWTRELIPLN
jgi:surface carbohydrate biosynthesis protein